MRAKTWTICCLLLWPAYSAPAREGAATAPPTVDLKAEDTERLNLAMTPGEVHHFLAELAGEWTWVATTWMAPGTPAIESRGKSSKRMILGGRFLEEVVEGELMAEPFEGRGTIGWDNLAKEIQSTWIDNFATHLRYANGKLDADRRGFTLWAQHKDPLTERREILRLVTRILDRDHHVFQYWAKPAGAAEWKRIEIHFARAK